MLSLLVRMTEQRSVQPKIALVSSDGEQFEVDRDVIRLSTTINTMLQGSFKACGRGLLPEFQFYLSLECELSLNYERFLSEMADQRGLER